MQFILHRKQAILDPLPSSPFSSDWQVLTEKGFEQEEDGAVTETWHSSAILRSLF